MVNNWKYSTTIKSRPLLYTETKKLADLILQGYNELKLKEQVINNNIFQVKSESRKRELASTILSRLNILDEYLTRCLIESDVETSKILVLYTIVRTDRLFYEFMDEILSEKLAFQDPVITDSDFNSFFESKRQQSNKVAGWKEYTFYKLKQVYIRILFESGLLLNQKGERKVVIPIINPDIIDHIKKHDDPRYINVLAEVEYEDDK
ncbi:hypothetical protein GCM10007063_12570 [Lentibacillus kapialis]|uniref:DUF1819 family protein n=1 Tax=Lentibacillus kapialis TaxID=340214 RepID=A0A917PU47_9BACI|nr:DUF1819 family protein [Lentibacillus kapialis]GGJ91405.1 hypothetical protein GCM10007063_12570 [Lentibacillus kapialis]